MQEKLFFYYTNDLHSNFEQWPKVASFMKSKKANHKKANENYWLIDIGDHVDRVHPIAEAFLGKANVKLLNELEYDVATIGNNEGITLSHDELFHLYDDATFDVVCANLNSTEGRNPDWLQSTKIVQSKNGVKIGFIGLTAPFNDYYHLLNWHVSNPYDVLETYLEQLKQKTDIIVLLSHLGITEDEEIARRYPEIDVIIGGHTHHLLRTGKTVNNTILTAAGKHCTYVGEVILTLDTEKKEIVEKEAYATNIESTNNDTETEQRLDKLQCDAEKALSEVVVHTKEPIEVKWFEETSIMQHLTDTMLQWTKADCALLNAGVLVEEFPVGDITYGDVHRICPHPINPCVVELTGRELMEVVRSSLTHEFTHFKLKGFGFRGKVLGRMLFSGLKVNTDFHEDGQEYVTNISFDKEPINPEQTYTVATADTFTFGRILPEIARSKLKTYFLPEFLRDLLVETLIQNYGRSL
ncbi:bifunctional metallophosphatase/5'-nucleotidase [Ornithinibacillus halophilus]|uniref:2',3'-cyclic-nucleotide 2'-phosphodiesterase/5'-or 3'-nucleotidase, 5'-nucleotidase family n=1 Tax=Ornithinibacillus halophilus TaxID=930117 RepID=A0A1M5JN30_9BACI|nr:bifunctional UDP-sugar hydrolase/5'-nucleotidase [Ornithinibacillus halophilus]SHG41941.1 2',3'-cyclic-nucleotide 2'-phosphodiesterase/5'-or 3'-nucleotidase, 5'-nucleotidase family [Ornithinibacillus halophilus]